MDEIDFEGSRVLEKLVEINKVDAFLEAIDADNFGRVRALMKQAGVDPATIATIMKAIEDHQ
jgi:hypothetical protein